MQLHEAIKILSKYQEYRKGLVGRLPYSSKKITEAIDVVISYSYIAFAF